MFIKQQSIVPSFTRIPTLLVRKQSIKHPFSSQETIRTIEAKEIFNMLYEFDNLDVMIFYGIISEIVEILNDQLASELLDKVLHKMLPRISLTLIDQATSDPEDMMADIVIEKIFEYMFYRP